MIRFLTKIIMVLLCLLTCLSTYESYGQSITITGKVSQAETNEPLAGVNISVRGKLIGTITDGKGNFTLNTTTTPPFTLVISAVGFETQESEISGSQSDIAIALKEQIILGQEVVVSASRVEESILQSPVSVEKIDIRSIRETPAVNFYDALANIKGIDLNTQSLTFKSINTRGFNANGNSRLVQMIDGMDNQAPGLNFSVGNIVGMSELDVESVEVLPGASSALYGPNAIQGIVLMNSKNPFQYQGFSATAKAGIMNLGKDDADPNMLQDYSIRYAKAFNNKFAFKVNASYLQAHDWQATDYRDKSTNGYLQGTNRQNNPDFDGVNMYGDETRQNMQDIAKLMVAAGVLPSAALNFVPDQFVSRTGYLEKELVNYNTRSVKLNAALHYRIGENLEAILQGNYGNGTTVYTGSDRYSLTGFDLGQFKAELKGSNFFLRAYTTLERSGDSYAGGTLGQLINEKWKPSQSWYPQYVGAYLTALNAGQSGENAHNAARGFADQGRFTPGSSEFNAAKDQITASPLAQPTAELPRGGARFSDKTNLYHFEGMYNLNKLINFAEVVVGANYRIYDLNSEGTLFTKTTDGEEYNINEYGGYIQIARRLLADKLKLTGSVRYDKNANFKGQFSPRISAVYTVAQTHNIRLSYQTGFRIPTTQDQYIDLLTPNFRLIGGLPLFRDKYNMYNNPVYTAQSVASFRASLNPALLEKYAFKDFQPERVQSYEIGYKSLLANKLLIDGYFYYNSYTRFSAQQGIVQFNPTASNPFANPAVYVLPVNSDGTTTSLGWALGLDYVLPKGFNIGGNVAYNALNTSDPNIIQTQFNTPRYRSNVSFGNRSVFKNIGFNVIWRWQDAFLFESSFTLPAENTIIPAFNTVDAQVSYKITPLKSILKVGASNLFNRYYTQAFGNPSVGGIYYISLTFDELLN